MDTVPEIRCSIIPIMLVVVVVIVIVIVVAIVVVICIVVIVFIVASGTPQKLYYASQIITGFVFLEFHDIS